MTAMAAMAAMAATIGSGRLGGSTWLESSDLSAALPCRAPAKPSSASQQNLLSISAAFLVSASRPTQTRASGSGSTSYNRFGREYVEPLPSAGPEY